MAIRSVGRVSGRNSRPGWRRAHLAISLAIAAAESGRRVYYGTLADLVDSLAEAKTAGGLARRLKCSPIRPCSWSTRSATCR